MAPWKHYRKSSSRKSKKVHKKRARKSTATKLREKVYNYRFGLQPQGLTADQTNVDQLNVIGRGPLVVANVTTLYSSIMNFSHDKDFGFACPFRLTDILQYADFTKIYDNYKINSVSLVIEFVNNQSNIVGPALAPTLYYMIDQDDAAVPANTQIVTGRPDHRVHYFVKNPICKITIKPKIAAIMYSNSGGGIGFAQPSKALWCDSAYPNIEYYSLKGWMTDVYTGASGAATGWRLNWQYNVSFKGVLDAT